MILDNIKSSTGSLTRKEGSLNEQYRCSSEASKMISVFAWNIDTDIIHSYTPLLEIRALASNTIPSAVDVTEYLLLPTIARLQRNFQDASSLKLLCHSVGSITVS